MADLQTAACEACINAIEHGNRLLARRRVCVRLSKAPEYVEVVVQDEDVVRFQAAQAQPTAIEQTVAGLPLPSGMGRLLLQQLADECESVAGDPGVGNRCRLRMYL